MRETGRIGQEMERKRAGYLCLLLTFILWGSLYVVSKYVLGKMPPFTISLIRFILAFAAMAAATRDKGPKFEKKDYKYILLIGAGKTESIIFGVRISRRSWHLGFWRLWASIS